MAGGRWCRICERRRPSEKFNGRGHRTCICKDCQRRPREEVARIEVTQELYGYLEQSRISAGNLKRLTALSQHEDEHISAHAALILAIAKIYPYKKKRWKRLVKTHFSLFRAYKQFSGTWIEDDEDLQDVFDEKIRFHDDIDEIPF